MKQDYYFCVSGAFLVSRNCLQDLFLKEASTDLDSSYDVTVIQWITSYRKIRMTTRVKTFWRVYETSLTTTVSTMRCLSETMLICKAIKSHFKRSYDIQNLHSFSFHMKIMKLAKGTFHKCHMKCPLS